MKLVSLKAFSMMRRQHSTRERERERESLCVCEDEGDDAKAKESFEGLILRTKHFHLSFLWCSNGEYSVSIGHFALPNLPHTFS